MIVVDTSVWIHWFNGRDIPFLDQMVDRPASGIILGDIVLLEILQGVRSEAQASQLHQRLLKFRLQTMLTPELAVVAARHYRFLRGLGVTIRKVPDLIIGTFCIENDHALLQDDRDFKPMAEHLGLRLV